MFVNISPFALVMVNIKVLKKYRLYFRCTYYAGTIGSGKTAVLLCSRLVTGRYVYVSLRVREYLTLCEVEVFEGKGKCGFSLYVNLDHELYETAVFASTKKS